MNYEAKLIELINGEMPLSPLRKSKSGEVDSEVILLGDKEFLFSMDDFSNEDLLPEKDPFMLGWCIACGAISDIIGAGGKPLLYAHSMVIPRDWDEEYLRSFSKGIAAVLAEYSISFCGGDLGIADKWRYTASMIGIPTGRIVNRIGCKNGDAIFITGRIGAGNLAAITTLFADNESIMELLKGNKIGFPTHTRLSGLLSKYATCAIDTSDGVFSALQTISTLNNTGFKLNSLPYHPQGVKAADLLQLPELLLFLGECGEYQILFTVSPKNKADLISELQALDIEAYELGEIDADHEHQLYATSEHTCINLIDYTLRARDFTNVRDYLKAMIAWLRIHGQ